MNPTLSHAAPEPISERDAAWFEELAEAVERGRAALLVRQSFAMSDAALSLNALVDVGQAGASRECEKLVWRLRREMPPSNPNETATTLIALARSGYAVRAACAAIVYESINALLNAQNRDGGWLTFDADTKRVPSCPGVTATVLKALSYFGFRLKQSTVDSAVKFLLSQQEENGGWSDANTWRVLVGLQAVDFDMYSLVVRRAVRSLKESQNEDGGWGEVSTADQTAQALLGLIAAGETNNAEVRAGAEYLVGTQRGDSGWGLPRVSHQKQQLSPMCLPLMALGQYLAVSVASCRLSIVSKSTSRLDSAHNVGGPKVISSNILADR